MSEPTNEELLARIAELEKRAETKKSGKLEFKYSRTGSSSPRCASIPPSMECRRIGIWYTWEVGRSEAPLW